MTLSSWRLDVLTRSPALTTAAAPGQRLPQITSTITISGNGAVITRTDGDFRFFYVDASGSLTLQNLTLSNGLVSGSDGKHGVYYSGGGGGGAGMGGAIFNEGTLALDGVALTTT